MTSKTQTEQYLRNVQLPAQTDSYTVISHGVIIDTVRQMLADNGFTIKEELYKGEANGNIALGFMQLENDTDPDMGMTFNWANSYNKQVRFSCAIGGFIYDNSTPFVSGTNQGKWNRKHTGDALDETKEVIEAMIVSAQDHFAEIIAMKEQFKAIKLSRKEYAKLSGLFFFDKMLISPDQVNVLRREYDKPAHDYSAKGTLWEYYKMLMLSVVDQSPKTWYKQQSDISNYINILYSISKSPVAIGEMDLVDGEPSKIVDFVTDEEEDEVMDSMFKAIAPAEEVDMTPIDNLIDAQNLIIEPLTGPVKSMEEKVEPCVAHDLETQKEEEGAVTELPDAFNWGTEEADVEEIVEEAIIPTEAIVMEPEAIEMIKEEHGIIETGNPDDGLIGSSIEDSEIESMFEMIDDIVEEEVEVPWFTDEAPQEVNLSKAPALIPDSMREAVTDILENSYQNKRKVTNSVETADAFLFELDSEEFFAVEK